jgi:hypothetical protein
MDTAKNNSNNAGTKIFKIKSTNCIFFRATPGRVAWVAMGRSSRVEAAVRMAGFLTSPYNNFALGKIPTDNGCWVYRIDMQNSCQL